MRQRIFLIIALTCITSTVWADLINIEFDGYIAKTSGDFTNNDTFTGHFIYNTETPDSVRTSQYSSGDMITTHNYTNPIIEFVMEFDSGNLSFTPDGNNSYWGSDSKIGITQDQKFTGYYGDAYYVDRFILTMTDISGSYSDIDFVQFDFFQSQFSGNMPDLLSSNSLPMDALDLNRHTHFYEGRVATQYDRNINFHLNSMRLASVPEPNTLFLFATGLLGVISMKRTARKGGNLQ
jgi:hypothetical protein